MSYHVTYAPIGQPDAKVTGEFATTEDIINWLRNAPVSLVSVEEWFNDDDGIPCTQYMSKTKLRKLTATAVKRNKEDPERRLSYVVQVPGQDGYVSTAKDFEEVAQQLAAQLYLGLDVKLVRLTGWNGHVHESDSWLVRDCNNNAKQRAWAIGERSKIFTVDLASGPDVGKLTVMAEDQVIAILEDSELARGYVEMRAALEYFVGRVDNGSIRSKTTYDKYKALLEKYPLPSKGSN